MTQRKNNKTVVTKKPAKTKVNKTPVELSKKKTNTSKSKPVALPPRPVQQINHIAIILDESGSMSWLRNAALDIANKNIDTIREEAAKNNQPTTLTLTTFNTAFNFHKRTEPIDTCGKVDIEQYRPNGGTALFDAVHYTVECMKGRTDANKTNVSFMVITITDGEENSSWHCNATTLKEEMKQLQATDRWSFAFMLPQGNKQNFMTRFGIPDGNITEWDASVEGAKRATQTISTGLTNYYSMRSTGGQSTKQFFTTDLSKVSMKQVQKKLDDLSSNAKVAIVPKEVDIQTFCQDKFKLFVKGACFYQLTKPEMVHGNKKILIMEKGKTEIYGGSDARVLLGIPSGDVKVTPGNHANFDIFVQSTSTNRKLVRGTKLIFAPTRA